MSADFTAGIIATYPPWAGITGLAYFVMGTGYWGWHYVFGLS